MYDGPPIGSGLVQLLSPDGLDLATLADDLTWHSTGGVLVTIRDEVARWTNAARDRDDVLLFDIAERDQRIGQIFLHDIEPKERRAMVGYHLVSPRFRGRGIGSEALRLLVSFAASATDMSKLVIITAGDNAASQRTAEKAGFVRAGAPWEDPSACLFILRLSP